MFNGPTRTGSDTGSVISTVNFGTEYNGDGSEFGSPALGATGFPGLGNRVIVYPYLQLLEPESDTDIKFVEVFLSFTFGLSPTVINSNRFPSLPPGNLFPFVDFMPVDVVAERDGRRPGTNLHNVRWRAIRFPNPLDPENGWPGWTELSNTRQPAYVETALADFMEVYFRFIAVDRDATPIFREGESVQFQLAYGSFAHTY